MSDLEKSSPQQGFWSRLFGRRAEEAVDEVVVEESKPLGAAEDPTPELQETIRLSAFDQFMRVEDDFVSVVLKGHLLITEAITVAAKSMIAKPEAIDWRNLGAKRTIDLLEAVGGLRLSPSLIKALRSYNALRNAVVHSLDHPRLPQKLAAALSDAATYGEIKKPSQGASRSVDDKTNKIPESKDAKEALREAVSLLIDGIENLPQSNGAPILEREWVQSYVHLCDEGAFRRKPSEGSAPDKA